MTAKFKPLGDRILVKSSQDETKTKSGIILTDSATRGEKLWGKVEAVGTGIFSQTGDRIPFSVKVGDTVMYKKDMGGEKITIDGVEYLLFSEHELLGFLN